MIVSHFFAESNFVAVVLDSFFSFGRQKKWSLVVLDRWSSYTVTIVWELAWADSALVAIDECSSYRGGRLSRFNFTRNMYSIYNK